MLAFVLIEAALQVSTWFQKPEDRAGLLAGLTMPAEWERRPPEVEGTKHTYYWHNVLHVHNRESMRIVGEFPPKRPGTFRIIVLGDSLTYGQGIAEKDTYPRVLEQLLSEAFRVEVLNLGVSGSQSEDISRILRRQLPDLRPELVMYGVCLNDFLPSGISEYDNNRAYQVPLPYKDHFIAATLTGKLLEKQYDALLMRLGLRVDFFTDILKDFDGYQTRFARDVKAMNAFVRGHGLPPMVAMVLDQYPSTREKRYAIVQAAERHLREAGIRLIPSDYIQRNDGRKDWKVSPWEGHPNERANRVFALEFARVLRELPELQAYGHGAGDGASLGHAGPRPGRGPGSVERSGASAPGTG
jgi:lysophospholipase L1-like esterase